MKVFKMDYKIRIPKCYGDVIPMDCVAVAMAVAEATAFGNADFHEPVYPGAYRKIRDSLLDEIKKGELQVCDQSGFSISYDDAQKHPNLQVVTRYVTEPDWALLEKQHPEAKTATGYDWTVVKPAIDFGPTEIDVVATIFLRLHARIDQLNAWGEKRRGAAFSIDDNAPPWHDERGLMGLPVQVDKEASPRAAENMESPPPKESPADKTSGLANLFDPVKSAQLEAMFPDDGKWARHTERASRNGLKAAAKLDTGLFNPYQAARWWIDTQGPKGWTWDKCLRKLAKNLPERSIGSSVLLTGYDE